MLEKLRLRYVKTFFLETLEKILEKFRLRDVKTFFFRELNFGTGELGGGGQIISLPQGSDFFSTTLVCTP